MIVLAMLVVFVVGEQRIGPYCVDRIAWLAGRPVELRADAVFADGFETGLSAWGPARCAKP